MPVVSDIVCMFASCPAPPIWCFPDFEQSVSSTAASGTDMPAARTPPPLQRGRNSGRRSSTPTWSATGGTDSHCSRPAGGSRSYGNVRCASMECLKLRRCWTSGCVGTIWSSRRTFRFARHRPEPVRPAVRYARPGSATPPPVDSRACGKTLLPVVPGKRFRVWSRSNGFPPLFGCPLNSW